MPQTVTPSDISLDVAEQWAAQLSLQAYCERMDPAYETAPHIAALIERLQALERREIRHLMVFLPPRHSKTYHVSERFPAWWLGRHPEQNIIMISYAAELAQRNSRRVRGLIEDERNPFPDMTTASDSRAVNRWETNIGGGVLAVGIGGGMTGHGAHLLNIDDPFKNRQEADSEVTREHVWSEYQDAARTRLMPDGVQLLTQTRWHEDDLAGRILNSPGGKDWDVLSLPALAEPGDPLGREPGAALWPKFFPLHQLPSVARGEMTQRSFAAIYQQRPTALEGTLFKRKDIQRWHTLPPDRGERDGRIWAVILSVDGAWKEGVGTDFSVIATWATDGIDYYLLRIWRQQVEYPDLKAAILREYADQRWRPHALLVEDAASGIAAVQELRRETNLPVIAVKPQGSKEARADAVAPLFEAHKVFVPDRGEWVETWIDEHVGFPTAAHDDQVDTTTQALGRLSARAGLRDVPLDFGGEPGPEYPRGSFRARDQQRQRERQGTHGPARSG